MKPTKYILTLLIINYTLLITNCYSQQWRVFTTSNSPLPSNIVSGVIVDRNNVKWISTFKGLVKIENNNWYLYDTSNTPLETDTVAIRAVDSMKNIWTSIYMRGIAKFDGTNWTIYNTTNSGLPNNSVASISIDDNNTKWIASGGLTRFDGTNWTIYNTTNSGLPSNVVTSVAIEGHIKWIGTFSLSGGMAKFNDTNWVIYNTGNSGLPSNRIRYVRLDYLNNKWICTELGGLARFNSELDDWIIYNTSNSNLPSNNCYSFASNLYVKYIGTDAGIAQYNDTTWVIFNVNNSPLPNNFVASIALDYLGNVWIATSGGLAIYNSSNIIGIKNPTTSFPKLFKLYQNYPNPFNSETIIEYEIKKKSFVKLIVYDITGKTADVLVNNTQQTGTYRIKYNASELSSGIYFYKLLTPENFEVRKFILVK